MSNSSLSKTLKSYLTIENIVFVLIIGSIVLYVGAQYYVFHTSNPQVAVTTTSMVPTYQGFDLTQNYELRPMQYYDILRGDLLLVQNKAPHVGDVVVFNATMSDGGRTINCMVPLNIRSDLCTTPIVHRLVAERTVNGQVEFATKGDHNPYTDAGDSRGNDFGWIHKSAILGVVVFAIHHLGWFSLQLQSDFVRILLILAIGLIILLSIWDSIFPSNKDKEKEKVKEELQKTKKVFFKFKNFRLRINRPNLSVFIILLVILTSYFGIGLINFGTNHNTVQWLPSGKEETSGLINLRDNTAEKYGTTYMYDTVILINSSGTLNFVNKLEINAVFTNTSTSTKNPTYIWTIVYDFAGSKLIHAVFVFNIPTDLNNVAISTNIEFTLYSTGLLAAAPYTMTQQVTVLV